LGNILTGPTGTYAYGAVGYANPHAATNVGGNNLQYDNNGNVTTSGTSTYTWDYNNRLTQASTTGGSPTPTTVTFYPAAGDGSVAYNSSNSWATTQTATSGSASFNTSPLKVDTGFLKGNKYQIERAFLPFDTSSL